MCFCSSVRAWPKPAIARVILITSAAALLAIISYGIYGLVTGVPSATFGLVLAVFLGFQSYQLYQAYQAGTEALEAYPLFRGAGAPAPGGGARDAGMPSAGHLCVGGILVAALAIGMALPSQSNKV